MRRDQKLTIPVRWNGPNLIKIEVYFTVGAVKTMRVDTSAFEKKLRRSSEIHLTGNKGSPTVHVRLSTAFIADVFGKQQC